MKKRIAVGLVAALIASNAGAAETQIVYRSATTGTAVPAASPSAPSIPTAPEEPTYQPLTVTLAGNLSVKVGATISIRAVTNGGSGDFSYDLITMMDTGLPGGVSLDQTGLLSGVPNSAGSYPVGISVYDRKTHVFVDSPMVIIKIAQ